MSGDTRDPGRVRLCAVAPSNETTEALSREYVRGFNTALRAALHAAAATASRGEDSRSTCTRAQIIEAISGLKPTS